MFLGPRELGRRVTSWDSRFEKITLAAELQAGLKGSLEARRPVRQPLQTSRQETVGAGHRVAAVRKVDR